MKIRKTAISLAIPVLLFASFSVQPNLHEVRADPMSESPTAGSNPVNLPANMPPPEEEGSAVPSIPSVDTSNKEVSGWAAEEVDWMVSNSIVPPQLQYNYLSNITREEFSSLAVSVLEFMSEGRVKLIHTVAENRFEDTDSEDVYKAYSYGIINGVSEQEFQPANPITRQEAAVMMANLLRSVQAKNLSPEDFPYEDRLSIADWALDSVDMTSNIKIFQGTDIGFRPYDNYTREQAIVVMRRLLGFEGHAHMVSLRGHVAIHIEDLGSPEDAKANKARPMAALVGTSSVKFVWTEASQTANAYLARFEGEAEHEHEGVAAFSRETLAKLKSGESPVQDGAYTLTLGGGTQQKGYLLGIAW